MPLPQAVGRPPDKLIGEIIAAAYSDRPDVEKITRIRAALIDSWTGSTEYARSFDVGVD